MLSELTTIITHEVKLAYRRGGESLQSVGFFVMVTSFFPLALGGDLSILAPLAPGIIWITALFSCTLLLPNLFERDYEDGTLDQWLLCPVTLEWVVLAKIIAYWLVSALPLVLLSPMLAMMLGQVQLIPLMLSLLLGTLALCFLGAVGAGLLIGNKHKGLLLPILIFPLMIPFLIFGSFAASPGATGKLLHFAYSFLLGATGLLVPLCALVVSMLIRSAVAE